ncbi:PKD domain-containing protein [Marinobacter sp. LV10R510-11A]|uniref:putative Ig domain-containing protein n=1 Tax=Marinobacter sp. LV10R510-11A TaxID=1415568 RepID=UPI000BB9395E|nr:putative Ig domain-containing protein [Marinobacter sp. LV10R510-11A]SOB76055.1 PKD domain-containing protein [Marinobacter sp. LV10R510-11A]
MKRSFRPAYFTGVLLAGLHLLSSPHAMASQAPLAADVLVVIDESGSMSGEQRWIGEMIPLLDDNLKQYGIGNEARENLYGLIGYGNSRVVPRSLLVSGEKLGAASAFVDASRGLVTSGGTEDGWRGIEYALDEYSRRNGAAVNIILATDEDRDNTESSITYQTVRDKLNENRALLNAVVNARVKCADGTSALGVDSLGTGYVADGSGGFTTCEGASARSGSGRTIAHYVDLAMESGGAAWDLNFLRSGGTNAESFTRALLDIKVEEILSQRPTGDLVAVVQATPNPAVAGETITLDGTGSFHQKDDSLIVRWEWDLDDDGIYDAEGPVLTTSFPELGEYPVTLRVTDDSQTPLVETARVIVDVDTPPLQPTADAGGPYLFCPQTQPWYVDGSGSVNPDDGLNELNQPADRLTAWEWDFDNDLAFDDASGERIDVTSQFSGMGTGDYLIRLRATDNTSNAFPSSGQPNLSDVSVTQVRIRDASDAACNCLTDLAVRAKMTKIQLTWSDSGASSYAIYRSEQEGGPYTQIATTDNRYSTYLDTGLQLDTTYYYAVSELGTDGRPTCRSREVNATPTARRLNPSNRPPEIHSSPIVSAVEGELYQYSVEATDPDRRDRIEFNLQVAPSGMVIDANTGEIEWTPVNAQVGQQTVVVRVSDRQGEFGEQVFTVNVTNVNQAPRIVSSPESSATERQSYNYQVQAIDPDFRDTLSYQLLNGPQGMTLDSDSGLVVWTPQDGQAGIQVVTIRVTDAAGEADTQSFELSVRERNYLPVISSKPAGEGSVATEYRYLVQATDENADDELTFALGEFPEGMVISPLTGEVTWTPQAGQEGVHSVSVVVSDSRGASSSQNFDVLIAEQNFAPAFTTGTLPDATEDQSYRYTLTAADTNNDEALTFSLISGPSNLQIDPASGEIAWLPVSAQVGENPIRVRVTDSRGLYDQADYVLNVISVNVPLEIISTPPLTVEAGYSYEYQVVATDDSGVNLEYRLIEGPAGLSMSSGGLLTWVPGISDAGANRVTIQVVDQDGASATQSFSLQVNTGNQNPVIESNPPTSTRAGQPYNYAVSATDADGDSLTYSLTQAPAGMVISAAGQVSWTPTEEQAGAYGVAIRVMDGNGGGTSQSFMLEVSSSNAAPSIVSSSLSPAVVGEVYQYAVVATDPEGQPLTYTLVSAPGGMTINESTGHVEWLPSKGQVGSHPVAIRVEDSAGASVTQSFTLTVVEKNTAPVIESNPPTSGLVDEPYLHTFQASDEDGDSLSWSLVSGPAGMSLDSVTGVLSWTPTPAQAGSQQFTVAVTDSKATVGKIYTAMIGGDSALPRLGNKPKDIAEVGKPYVYRAIAIDAEGYAVDVKIVSAPNGMVLSDEQGIPTIRWTPSEGDCVKSVTLELQDRFGRTAEASWEIRVLAAPKKFNRIQCSAQSQACGG